MTTQRWQVTVTERIVHQVEVEADGWLAARDAGAETVRKRGAVGELSSAPQRALGEPWCTGGWCYGEPETEIVLFERSYGYLFTKAEVELLKRRLASLGFVPYDDWNGAGCTSLSIACKGRAQGETFTSDAKSILLGPRPDGLEET